MAMFEGSQASIHYEQVGTGPDIDQITGDARRRGLDAVPKRVGNHGLPRRGQKSQFAPLGETHQSG